MKQAFASAEYFGISSWRLVVLALAVGIMSAWALGMLVGDALGPSTWEGQVLVSLLVFYCVVSAPRRMLKAIALAQSREAVLLTVIAKACLAVGGSRARTLLLIDSREEGISHALTRSKKKVLLGIRVRDALVGESTDLASYSAANAFRGLGELAPGTMDEKGEEAEGRIGSARLADETNFPIFMSACFFVPILLLLYAVFSHLSTAVGWEELIVLEFVVLDVAFYLCSAERGGGLWTQS